MSVMGMSQIKSISDAICEEIRAIEEDLAAAHDLIREMREDLWRTRPFCNASLLAKADDFLSGKQEVKKARFGCHVRRDNGNGEEIFGDCDPDDCGLGYDKSNCLHWREVQESA